MLSQPAQRQGLGCLTFGNQYVLQNRGLGCHFSLVSFISKMCVTAQNAARGKKIMGRVKAAWPEYMPFGLLIISGVKTMTATRIWILVGIVIVAAGLPGMASAATSVNEGYLVDSEEGIVKNGSGGCWHTGYWTSAMAIAECDAVAARKDEVRPSPKVSAVQPQPVPVHEKMPLLKINLSEDSLFDFDKSVLKPNGKVMLDGLVRELDGVTYEVVYVTGHTDRIGSAAYNVKLSLRRANEVKGYLVKKGISADSIKTEGKGKAQPITKSTDCRGLTSARTIACLQPDRRIEVTVVGNK